MRSDTELLYEILSIFSVRLNNDLSWPFNEKVDGLRQADVLPDDVIDDLVKRRRQLLVEK